MTTSEPNVPDTGLYSITEAAEILGISTRTILRHVNAQMIRCKIRKCNNRRVFTGREIKRYWGAQY